MAIAAFGFSYNQIRVRSRFQFRKKIPQKIRARSDDQIKCWLTGLGREAGFRLPNNGDRILRGYPELAGGQDRFSGPEFQVTGHSRIVSSLPST